ncbi:phosphotriesterase-related protein [Microbacterium sp. SORGH_AS 1204]|uniref:phosphotriesterase family protein n=1 Tax=Microbacterium sp. SORGH_AS_1204 TaxID=3041785 RepID=UPI002792A5D8|nr:phosphotriesterase-related protein [Microbacterium sp. SORGH_AS_1204]MDQ1136259.1 phosphotriesterase-related protein [Microbacterium sp. SORGH_AS_1204]
MVTVRTVTGEVSSDALGFVLPHEHLLNSIEAGGLTPDPDFPELFDQPVGPELAWILRDRPYANRDNCVLDEPDDAAAELAHFRALGGTTVIEVTSEGQGRDRPGLASLSHRTGVQIIAGGGWYLERFHPDATRGDDVDALTRILLADYARTDDSAGPRSGVIGEIGVSPAFTAREEKSLRAACRLQLATGLPMWIHLPGFVRHGGRVLDVVLEEERVDPAAVVLCHMDPSGADPDYQRSLAERGVWLEFDMIGMPYRFTLAGEGQSPAPHESAIAIQRLCRAGFGGRILISHDLFLKSMLRKNGGNGLAYIPAVFLDRLLDLGVDETVVRSLNTTNVRDLFELAARV